MIRRFINLVARGEQGILDEINGALYHYSFDIETAPPGIKERYILMLLQLHKQLHGDPKLKEMEEKPKLTVIINEMGARKEIVPYLEAGPIGNSTNNLIAAQVVAQAEHEDDEDSLYTSPMLQDLITHEKRPAIHHLSAKARNTEQGPGGMFRRIKKDDVQEQDSKTGNDERIGTEGQPGELEEAPGSTESGS
jgi:hypothetical protein